jgi:UDP-glucose 4-epimerase
MVHELADAGEQVIVLDNLSTGFRSALREGVPLYVVDVGDPHLVSALIDAHCVKSIIHFAASIVVPDSLRRSIITAQHGQHARDSRKRGELRGRAFHLLIDRGGLRKSVMPISEQTPTIPMAPYGSSKLMSEIMLHDVAAAHGMRYAILRYSNVAGADPQQRTGQMTAGATPLVKVAIETALDRRASSTSLEPIIRRRTAPASATTSMSAIWRARIRCLSRICAAAGAAPRSIADTGTAIRCSK